MAKSGPQPTGRRRDSRPLGIFGIPAPQHLESARRASKASRVQHEEAAIRQAKFRQLFHDAQRVNWRAKWWQEAEREIPGLQVTL